MFPPSPPGDTILDVMVESGITHSELGKKLEISDNDVLDLINGKLLIDDDMAYRLSVVLGSTAQFWENREKQYRERIVEYERR
jgi:HTH-type transcriptional regulator / antitoxin HigA